MVTSDFRPEVEIRPFRACAMHLAIIIGTVCSLWTWLWGRYHVAQNAFLVIYTYNMKLVHWHGSVATFDRRHDTLCTKCNDLPLPIKR